VVNVGSNNNELRLVLRDGHLQAYRALRYCWGKSPADPRAFKTVKVNIKDRLGNIYFSELTSTLHDVIHATP